MISRNIIIFKNKMYFNISAPKIRICFHCIPVTHPLNQYTNTDTSGASAVPTGCGEILLRYSALLLWCPSTLIPADMLATWHSFYHKRLNVRFF